MFCPSIQQSLGYCGSPLAQYPFFAYLFSNVFTFIFTFTEYSQLRQRYILTYNNVYWLCINRSYQKQNKMSKSISIASFVGNLLNLQTCKSYKFDKILLHIDQESFLYHVSKVLSRWGWSLSIFVDIKHYIYLCQHQKKIQIHTDVIQGWYLNSQYF